MVLPALFGAATSIIPSLDAIRGLADLVADTSNAFNAASTAAKGFYSTVIGSNLELQQIVRQSTIVIAAQTKLFDKLGNELDFDKKIGVIGPKIKQIQKEIELATRDIVGATDTQTNAILNQTLLQFGTLQNQSKKYKDELDAIPELVANIASAANAFQIPEVQFPQELRSLFQGDLNNPDSQLAKQLASTGFTKEAFEAARAAGEGLDFINEKLAVFSDFNASGADSIVNSFSVIQDITSQIFRTLGGDPTEGLRLGLKSVTDLIANAGLEEKLTAVAQAFGGPVGQAISESFARATAAIQTFIDNLPTGALELVGSVTGKILGDVISIATDVGLAIAKIVADIVLFTAAVIEAGEKIAKVLTLDFGTQVNFDEDEANASVKATVEEYAKTLETNGLLRRAFNFVIALTPFGIINNIGRAPQINQIEEAAQRTAELFQSETDGVGAKQLDFLLEMAPKIAAVDIADLSNFKADLLNPIQDEVNRLGSTIDFSKLSASTASEVRGVLASINSASDFAPAQKKIKDIVGQAQVGTKEELDKFAVYQSLLAGRIKSIKDARDELVNSKKEGNIGRAVNDEILEYTKQLAILEQQQKDIAVKSDSDINEEVTRRRQALEGLKENSKKAKQIRAEITDLENKALSSAGLSSQYSAQVGGALTKTYSDLSNAVQQMADGLGDTEQLNKEFEMLSKAVTNAEQLGTNSISQLIGILQTAAFDSTQSVENRLKAQQDILGLIQKETEVKAGLVDIEKQLTDNKVAKGELSEQAAAIEQNSLDLTQRAIQLEGKKAELAQSLEFTRKNGLEALQAENLALQSQVAAATGANKTALEKQLIANQIKIETAEAGSLEQQKLKTEVDSLQVQYESLSIKNSQLVIDEKLAAISKANQQATEELNRQESEGQLRIAEMREAGFLKSDLDLEKQQQALTTQQEKLAILREEISAREELNTDNLSESSKLELQSELNSLLTEENNLQTQVINARLDFEQAQQQALISREQLILGTVTKEIDANNQLLSSVIKIGEAINKSKQAQQELLASNIALQNSLNSTKIVSIDIEQAGIDRIIKLKEELSKEEPGSDRAELLEKAIATTSEIANVQETSLSRQLELITSKAELEQANADQSYNLSLRQLELENQIALTQVDGANLALQTELKKIDVKQQELELEKQILKAKIDSGEISQEAGSRQIAAIGQIQTANSNVAASIKEQLDANTNQVIALETILDNKRQILQNEYDSATTNRAITAEYERQDTALRSQASAPRSAGRSSGGSDDAEAPSGKSTTFRTIRNEDGSTRREYRNLDGTYDSGGGKQAKSAFKSESGPTFRGASYSAAEQVVVSKLAAEFDSANPTASKFSGSNRGRIAPATGATAGLVTGQAYKRAIERDDYITRGLIASRKVPSPSGSSTSSPSRTTATSFGRPVKVTSFGMAALRPVKPEEALEQRILELKNSILTLQAAPRTDETQKKLSEQIAVLKLLTDVSASGNSEQISLLDAIKQNAFQNAGFKEGETVTVNFDPETRELIISGTRPDTEKLDSLITLGSSQLGELIGINKGTVAANNNSASTAPSPTQLQREIAANQLNANNITDFGIANVLKNAGLITEEQRLIQETRGRLAQSSLTALGKIDALRRVGQIDDRTASLYNLRYGPKLTDQGKLLRYEQLGFSSRQEGDQTLAQLASLEDVIRQFENKVAPLASARDLKAQLLNGSLPNLITDPRFDFDLLTPNQRAYGGAASPAAGPAGGSSSGSSVSSAALNNGGTIVGNRIINNNYYPNQAGSVSAQLRTGAL